MIKQPIYSYYWLGTCVRFLQDIREGAIIVKEGGDNSRILYNITSFLERLDKFNLPVTKRASYVLNDLHVELKEAEEGKEISEDQAGKLRDAITQIRHTLDAELQGIHAYTISPKRIDVEKAVESVVDLFSPGVFLALPEVAQYDFGEAAKCIAFERPTAAAFHLLRGTESVLKSFYCAIVKRGRIKDRMWGPMVNDLRAKRKAKQFSVLLDHLDNIRKSFRNPTAHPQKIYDIQEVQDLWGLCVDVVNRMAPVLGT